VTSAPRTEKQNHVRQPFSCGVPSQRPQAELAVAELFDARRCVARVEARVEGQPIDVVVVEILSHADLSDG
jgi:hypothetical protein